MEVYKITEVAHIDPAIGSTFHSFSSLRHTSPEHTHDYYEFFLITQGKCIHKVNGYEQFLGEGSLVFIRPEDTHFYMYDGESDCEFLNVACSFKTVEAAFEYIGYTLCEERLIKNELPPFVLLSPLEKEHFLEGYYKLSWLSTTNKFEAKFQFRGLLVEVLTYFLPKGQCVNDNETPLWFDSLLKKMQKKENFYKGITKMYELSGRSRGHINRVFRQYLSTTPTAYINKLRLNYAKTLILTSNLSITEICLEVGFNNLSYFYHQFKEHFGIAPAALR